MGDRYPQGTVEGRRLFDTAPAIMMVLDRDRRVLDANRRCRELFGEPRGEHCHVVLKGRRLPCAACPAAATFADGAPHWRHETLANRRGGGLAVMSWTAPLGDSRHGVDRVLRLSTDISPLGTDRNGGALEALLAAHAHAVRGLITAMDGGLYQLERVFRGQHVDREGGPPAQLRRTAAGVRDLLQDLIEGSGAPASRPGPIDLVRLVREALDAAAARGHRRDVRLAIDPPDFAVEAWADRRRLGVAMTRLMEGVLRGAYGVDFAEVFVKVRLAVDPAGVVCEVRGAPSTSPSPLRGGNTGGRSAGLELLDFALAEHLIRGQGGRLETPPAVSGAAPVRLVLPRAPGAVRPW